MSKRSDPITMRRAAELRRAPTPAEARLWTYLRGHRLAGVKFRRQHAMGEHVVDFCALNCKLVIELEDAPLAISTSFDLERTEFLESQGLTVLRFYNSDVMNDLVNVLLAIANVISRLPSAGHSAND